MPVEWSKLKNIIILILLIVNALLLVMVVTQESSTAHYREQTLADTLAVLEQSGIQVERSAVPTASAPALTLERDRNGEADLAAALLGPAEEQDLGSGRFLYVSAQGSAEFRSNGNFSLSFAPDAAGAQAGADLAEHALACMEKLGFEGELLSAAPAGSQGVVVLRQLWQGRPVFSCTAELTYQDGRLVSAAGRRLMGTPAADPSAGEPISAPTALLRFLSGVSAMGDPCSRVTAIQVGYLLSAAETVKLTPAWYLTTDTGSYFLDTLTGELTRQAE